MLRQGRTREAKDNFSKGVGVSSETASRMIAACRAAGIEIVVAPYEADAQMAHLAKIGAVDAIITEDSDLLVYQAPR